MLIDIGDTCLRGRDPQGRRQEWHLCVEAPVGAGSDLATAPAVRADGGEVVVRSLPPTVPAEEAQAWLDNEIRVATRIRTAHSAEAHPAELPRIVGYEFDTAEPFALFAPYRAAARPGLAARLLDSERLVLAASLFRALAHLAALDIVHGGVALPAVRLSGANVVLVNFEHAVLTGEHSPAHGRTAHPGDDVLAAGLLLHEVYTGARLPAGHTPDDSAAPALRALLAGVFAEAPVDRPSALDLLRRLDAGDIARASDHDAALAAGRTRFDAARRAKLPDGTGRNGDAPPATGPAPVARPPQPPPPRPRRARWFNRTGGAR
ncbi:hypothetical protein FHS29_006202 [Saccharothrix tamanrassetensis]|uniref:Protein kinase domain-containing protein n=1 Tax=Saccharothrix tamanrassetensis TaxID=1051531 RepID=A0A841CPI6_9PSEU|nr:hypothetical protein [Saccharothrix tamanrassetensis]MBB5959581.1 hypothetical protein [Saccharothrix tamanrassetensis]